MNTELWGRSQVGFAQHMKNSGGAGPQRRAIQGPKSPHMQAMERAGFGYDETGNIVELSPPKPTRPKSAPPEGPHPSDVSAVATEAKPNRKHKPEIRRAPRYEFAAADIGREIVRGSIDAGFRRFHSTLEARAAKVGRVIAAPALCLVLVAADEINAAFMDGYTKMASDADEGRRNGLMLEVNHEAEAIIRNGRNAQTWAMKGAIALRNEQALRGDWSEDRHHESLQKVFAEEESQLWTPRTFAVDLNTEITGPTTFGLILEDKNDILRQEREAVVAGLCSTFDLKAHHFKADWEAHIDLVDTAPVRANEADLLLPPAVYDVTLGIPRVLS
ncbi:MAG: hypothetical protein JWN38_932 [Candidatus Saccharibacteria bacterium]|nr:hypothetical protein [Candidatus Saccharibacteria bacterium]